jgi:hypothetical protein
MSNFIVRGILAASLIAALHPNEASAAMRATPNLTISSPMLLVLDRSGAGGPCGIGVGNDGHPTITPCDPIGGGDADSSPSGDSWGQSAPASPTQPPSGGIGTPAINTSGGVNGASGPKAMQCRLQCNQDCDTYQCRARCVGRCMKKP